MATWSRFRGRCATVLGTAQLGETIIYNNRNNLIQQQFREQQHSSRHERGNDNRDNFPLESTPSSGSGKALVARGNSIPKQITSQPKL